MITFLWMTFELGMNIYQGILTTIFINRIFVPRKKIYVWAASLNSLLFAGACTLYMFWELPVADTWMFLIPFIYSAIFFKDSWKMKILWNVVLIALFNGIISVSFSLFATVFKMNTLILMEQNLFRVVFGIATNLMLTAAVLLVSGKKHHKLSNIPSMLLFILINILVVVIIDSLFVIRSKASVVDSQLLFTAGLTLCISVATIFLYEIMATYSERYRLIRENENTEILRAQRLDELRSIYSSLNSLRHDLRNHVQIAKMMIESGAHEESANYLQEIDQRIFSIFSTGCLALDSELTLKELAMRRMGIDFKYELCSLEQLPISDFDLCAMIGNLLDNAMEAVARITGNKKIKVIELKIVRVRYMLCISCINPADDNYVIKNKGKYVSTKKEKGHGMGISNIESIVRKVDGVSSFEFDHGEFRVEISLPYAKE